MIESREALRSRITPVSFGILCILLSSALIAPLSQTATKFLAPEFPVLQIIFVRSLGQTLFVTAFFWRQYGASMFITAEPKLQIARSALLFFASMFWISGIAAVPLTTASAISFTAPIMVVMMSIPLLGEKVGVHRWAAVLVGFAGALVVIRPGAGVMEPATLLLLVAAFLFALYQILTRKLAGLDTAATTSLYTVVVALIVSTAMIPWHYVQPQPADYAVWVAFVATGLLGGLRHYFVVKAYESASASVISPFFYSELVGVTALGLLVFGDFPDAWTITGAAIIALSGVYIAHRERLKG